MKTLDEVIKMCDAINSYTMEIVLKNDFIDVDMSQGIVKYLGQMKGVYSVNAKSLKNNRYKVVFESDENKKSDVVMYMDLWQVMGKWIKKP